MSFDCKRLIPFFAALPCFAMGNQVRYHATVNAPCRGPSCRVHYTRHAQKLSSVISRTEPSKREELFGSPDQICELVSDSKLSEQGIADASAMSADMLQLLQNSDVEPHGKPHVDGKPYIDAVFVSSFWRTMHTAELITQNLRDEAQIGEIIVMDEIREGMHNPRKDKSQLQEAFQFVNNWDLLAETDPAVPLYPAWEKSQDSSIVSSQADKPCPCSFKEPEEHMLERQAKFLEYLTRMAKEKGWTNVLIVSHSKFGGALLGRPESTKEGKTKKAMTGTIDFVYPELQKKFKEVDVQPFFLWFSSTDSNSEMTFEQAAKMEEGEASLGAAGIDFDALDAAAKVWDDDKAKELKGTLEAAPSIMKQKADIFAEKVADEAAEAKTVAMQAAGEAKVKGQKKAKLTEWLAQVTQDLFPKAGAAAEQAATDVEVQSQAVFEKATKDAKADVARKKRGGS